MKLTIGEGIEQSLLSRGLYYSQRLVTVPVLRKLIATLIAGVIRIIHGKISLEADNGNAAKLKRDGLVLLGELLSSQQCGDIHTFLCNKHLSDRYGTDERFMLDRRPDQVRMAEYDLGDVIDCPHILALANSDHLLGVAERYLGCKPTLSSLVLRWSFPTDTPAGNVQRFHRDADDWRYLKVMIYLTDVGESDGPHVYVLGTHKEAAPVRIRVEDDAAIHRRYGCDAVHVVTGQQGTGFVVDTAGIHKGEMPQERSRLMLQIQYSLLPSFAYRYCPQEHAAAIAFDRYVNRLFLA
jgi:hypothetical protein